MIRFAREIPGAADGAIPYLTQGGQLSSALILSPPGGGKTTFLRDLIRQLSTKGIRIGVVDQRRELAAQKEGENTLNLGPCTDVLSGCPKDQGMALAAPGNESPDHGGGRAVGHVGAGNCKGNRRGRGSAIGNSPCPG